MAVVEPSRARAPAVDGGWRLYTEDWDPAYGNPATFDLDDSDDVTLAEATPAHVPPGRPSGAPLCLIDGRRRAELSIWAEHPATGARIPGLAGCYAVGAVTIRPGRAATYEGTRLGRVVVWGGGRHGDLVAATGHRWASVSTTALDPVELLQVLQDRMREAEGNLALEAAALGWNVVLDGPLNRIRSLHHLVTGYVKTHRRQILPGEDHAAVPRLPVGGRTALYTAGTDRYTCYARVGNPGPGGSPWTGIARLDFPAAAGIDAVAARASDLAATLPAYAGRPHRDPRAPVNLTPVHNLERRLSQLMGPVAHATRAARDAVIHQGAR
jgi:hypothetical protein